jgi:chromosome segregation ATPase
MGPARVDAIDTLAEWKERLVGFRGHAQEALTCVELEIRRLFDWLDDQRKYWEHELRRREDQLVAAKADLWRRKAMPIVGKSPDTSEQEKNLRKAQQRLAEAEDKLERTKKWIPLLGRAVDEYRAQGHRLAGILEGDLPRALALLEQKLAALESYVRLTAPAASVPPPPAAGAKPCN